MPSAHSVFHIYLAMQFPSAFCQEWLRCSVAVILRAYFLSFFRNFIFPVIHLYCMLQNHQYIVSWRLKRNCHLPLFEEHCSIAHFLICYSCTAHIFGIFSESFTATSIPLLQLKIVGELTLHGVNLQPMGNQRLAGEGQVVSPSPIFSTQPFRRHPTCQMDTSAKICYVSS